MKTLDIKQEAYFPFNFRVFGVILIFAVPAVYISFPFGILGGIVGSCISILGLIFITAHYGLKVNIEQKTYTIYTWVLGIKFGKPSHFQFIDKFYVKEANESVGVTGRFGDRKVFRSSSFKAFMKLDNGDKVHVDTSKNRTKLESRLKKYMEVTQPIISPVGTDL